MRSTRSAKPALEVHLLQVKQKYGGIEISDIKRIFVDMTVENTDDARVERFNGSFRRELLDAYIFNSLSEVRTMAEEWMIDCNTERSHDALRKLTPIKFLERDNQATEKVTLLTV